MEFSGQALSWRHNGSTLEVELHRAPLNEIGTTTLAELERLATYVSEGAGGARALILWSSRPGFCAGADLRELHAGLVSRREEQGRRVERLADQLGPAGGLLRRGVRRAVGPVVRWEIGRFLERIHGVFDTLDQAPITTIAAVHGVVFGGGFELALTADILVAEKTTRFAFPELRLGLIPGFGGVPRLRRAVGLGVVCDLLLTGRSLNARRAHAVGLVSQLVPRGAGLDAARRVADQAAHFDPVVVAAAKAFAKPHPVAALQREKELFRRLVTRPTVFDALTRFVESEDVRPYLPG